jgi:2-polyprenyl-3-methyl-5-hydroxy-6-metoxy-1,4-benzoquinol methylase
MSSRDFYDGYVARQLRVGINARHRAIARGLRRFGWRPDDRVLEIGSGVGTLTALLAQGQGDRGELVGVDLSPKSIEAARQRLAAHQHVRLIAGDILKIELGGPFDVIVLPDVIEHIPLEHHAGLFQRVAGWLAPTGFVLLNYPEPHYLSWCREHRPDLLQAIDQPIHADVLLSNCRPAELYLAHLETYSLWVEEGDYVMAVLRLEGSPHTFTPVAPKGSFLTRVAQLMGRAR